VANYFVAAAFVHNRTFGSWFLLGLIVDAVLKGGVEVGGLSLRGARSVCDEASQL